MESHWAPINRMKIVRVKQEQERFGREIDRKRSVSYRLVAFVMLCGLSSLSFFLSNKNILNNVLFFF